MSGETIDIDKRNRDLGNKIYTDRSNKFETIFDDTLYTMTSTTPADVSNSSVSIYLEEQTAVLVLASFKFIRGGAGTGFAQITLNVDGTDVYTSVTDRGTSEGMEEKLVTIHHMETLAAGARIVKLIASLSAKSASETVDVLEKRVTAIKLVKN